MDPDKPGKLLKKTWAALAIIFIIGIALRLSFPSDIEFKSDEQYMFDRATRVGVSEPWPWLGVSSGVLIKNPGLSVWIFVILAKTFHVVTPPDLAQAVQILNILALGLMLGFALRKVKNQEQTVWLWAFALACVNPFAILYHRKIWAQSVLPFFCILFLIAWWNRSKRLPAFFWGLLGALLGQIHMSGFFYAFALSISTWGHGQKTRWKYWWLGSALGALPLIPWVYELINHAPPKGIARGIDEIVQFKYWVFWITDPLGLHLGNALGVLNGNGLWTQLREFASYPFVANHATYLCGLAHLIILGIAVTLVLRWWFLNRTQAKLTQRLRPLKITQTQLALRSALFFYGICLTLSRIVIRRYYLLVTFPFEFLWLTSFSGVGQNSNARKSPLGTSLLSLLILAELFISICFLGYIHKNGGAKRGDYGAAYHTLLKSH